MSTSKTLIARTLAALVIACAMGTTVTAPATAQTAKKLKCTGCVKSKQLKNGGVKNADLANGAVTGGKIADSAVDGAKITDNSVHSADLAPAAKPGGGDFHEESNAAFGLKIIPLASGDTIVRSVTLTLPAAGIVIANATGFFDHSGGARSTGRCELSTGNTIDVLYGKTVLYIDGESGDENAMALTRGFNVAGPGSITYKLICDRYSGPGDIDIVNPSMTAFYIPQKY